MPGIIYKISGDNSQFQKDVNQSEGIARNAFSTMKTLGIAAWAAIGAAVVAAMSAGASFIKDSVNVGMGFDKSMSQVAATMGKSVDQIQDLRDFALEMGATTAFSAQQAADGLNILAQSGLNATEQMQTLPQVLDLAASGGLDLATSAKYVTGAVKGFGDAFDNASYYTDLIATGAAQANTNVNQLGLALSDSAATAASYGQTADGTTLALLRLAEQNVTGSEAATALNRAMMDLYTPTDNAKKAMDKLGVSAYDSTGKARPLNDVIDDLTVAMDGMTDAEKNATKNAIFSTFGLQAYNKMTVSTTAKVNAFRSALDKSTGSAKKMSEVQLDNLAGDITLAKSAMEGFKITISDSVTPAIRDFVQKGTNEIGKLNAAFQEGGITGLADQLAKSAMTMGKDIVKYAKDFGKAAITFGKAFVSQLGQSLLDNGDSILKGAASLATKIGEGLVDALPKLGNFIGQGLAKIFLNLPSLVEGGFNLIMGLANGIWDGIGSLADGIKSGLQGSMSEPMISESEEVLAIIEGIKSKIDETKEHIGSLPEKLNEVDAEFAMAEQWVDIFDELANKTELTTEQQTLLQIAIDELNKLLPDGQKIVKDETGAWSTNTEEIKKNIAALKERARAEALAEYTKDLYKDILDLQRQRSEVEDKIAEKQTQQKQLTQDVVHYKYALQEVKFALDDVREAVSSGNANTIDWKKTWDSLPPSVKEFGRQIGITALDGVGDLGDLYNALQEVLGSEYEGSGLEGALAQNKKDIESLQSTYGEIETTIAQTEQAAKDSWKNLYNQGKENGEGYAEGIGDAKGDVANAAKGLGNTAQSNASVSLFGSGSNAGGSLASGLWSQVANVRAAAIALAKAAAAAVAQRLAIHSPSKVFEELGEFATEGLALGIEDTRKLNLVRQAGEKAADESISALTSGIDSSITATPVTGTDTSKIDMIITLLTTYLPNVGGDIVLDTGALVGHTVGQTDVALGQIQKRRARYE